jgi:hypothetical protein
LTPKSVTRNMPLLPNCSSENFEVQQRKDEMKKTAKLMMTSNPDYPWTVIYGDHYRIFKTKQEAEMFLDVMELSSDE